MMSDFLSVFIPFICLAAIVLYLSLKPAFDDKKARKGVPNSDTFMNNYVYLLHTDIQEAIAKLFVPNAKDPLLYSFDHQSLTITFTEFITTTFTEFNASIKYNLTFYTIDHTTYLKVSLASFFYSRWTIIPYKINSFFIQKLDAVPVVYSHFEKLLKNSPH